MCACVCAEQRERYKVVSPERQHLCAAAQDAVGVRLDGGHHGLRAVRVEEAVAVVDDAEIVERRNAPGKRLQLRQLHRGLSDRARAQARARAVGDGVVEGHAGDHQVQAGLREVSGVVAPKKRERPAVRHLALHAVQRLTEHRGVAWGCIMISSGEGRG